MREKAKDIVVGLLVGIAVGAVVECLVGLAGSVRGGVEAALQWAQIAGLLMGVVGIWMLTRQLSARGGRQVYRPGRTALELEAEVLNEHRSYEKTLRESDGEAHRMPRKKGISILWMDIGLVLSALLPTVAALLL